MERGDQRYTLAERTRDTAGDVLAFALSGLSATFELCLGLLLSWGYAYAALYVSRIMWTGYIETPTGSRFVQYFPMAAQDLAHLAKLNAGASSFTAALTATVVMAGLAGFCQVTSLIRYVYEARSPVLRTLIWGLIGAGLAAMGLGPVMGLHLKIAALLTIVPGLIMVHFAFAWARALLPELGWPLFNLVAAQVRQWTRGGGPG